MGSSWCLLACLTIFGYDQLMHLFFPVLEFLNILHLTIIYIFFIIRQYGYILWRRPHIDEILLVLGFSRFCRPNRFDWAWCLHLFELVISLGFLLSLWLCSLRQTSRFLQCFLVFLFNHTRIRFLKLLYFLVMRSFAFQGGLVTLDPVITARFWGCSWFSPQLCIRWILTCPTSSIRPLKSGISWF